MIGDGQDGAGERQGGRDAERGDADREFEEAVEGQRAARRQRGGAAAGGEGAERQAAHEGGEHGAQGRRREADLQGQEPGPDDLVQEAASAGQQSQNEQRAGVLRHQRHEKLDLNRRGEVENEAAQLIRAKKRTSGLCRTGSIGPDNGDCREIVNRGAAENRAKATVGPATLSRCPPCIIKSICYNADIPPRDQISERSADAPIPFILDCPSERCIDGLLPHPAIL